MHELSVTENVLALATKFAEENHAKKVTDVHLVIGRLSSIIDDSVQFYWDFISEDTLCEGATLHFKRIPAFLRCLDCNNEYKIEELTPCPECGGYQTRIISGEEFWLDSIEIER